MKRKSKKRFLWQLCHECKKLSAPTEGEAAVMASRKSKRYGSPYWVYECKHGNGWHLTTRKRGKP